VLCFSIGVDIRMVVRSAPHQGSSAFGCQQEKNFVPPVGFLRQGMMVPAMDVNARLCPLALGLD
jgi:hypothetical protein